MKLFLFFKFLVLFYLLNLNICFATVVTNNGIIYTQQSNDEWWVTGYEFQENVIITNEIDGHYVTQIATNAFENNLIIRQVIIPNTITNIQNSAFRNCEFLHSVIFEPADISSRNLFLGSSVFSGCISLSYINLNDHNLTLTAIGSAAFANCISLNYLNINAIEAGIGPAAFENTTSLKCIFINSDFNFEIIYSAFNNTNPDLRIHYPVNATGWPDYILGVVPTENSGLECGPTDTPSFIIDGTLIAKDYGTDFLPAYDFPKPNEFNQDVGLNLGAPHRYWNNLYVNRIIWGTDLEWDFDENTREIERLQVWQLNILRDLFYQGTRTILPLLTIDADIHSKGPDVVVKSDDRFTSFDPGQHVRGLLSADVLYGKHLHVEMVDFGKFENVKFMNLEIENELKARKLNVTDELETAYLRVTEDTILNNLSIETLSVNSLDAEIISGVTIEGIYTHINDELENYYKMTNDNITITLNNDKTLVDLLDLLHSHRKTLLNEDQSVILNGANNTITINETFDIKDAFKRFIGGNIKINNLFLEWKVGEDSIYEDFEDIVFLKTCDKRKTELYQINIIGRDGPATSSTFITNRTTTGILVPENAKVEINGCTIQMVNIGIKALANSYVEIKMDTRIGVTDNAIIADNSNFDIYSSVIKVGEDVISQNYYKFSQTHNNLKTSRYKWLANHYNHNSYIENSSVILAKNNSVINFNYSNTYLFATHSSLHSRFAIMHAKNNSTVNFNEYIFIGGNALFGLFAENNSTINAKIFIQNIPGTNPNSNITNIVPVASFFNSTINLNSGHIANDITTEVASERVLRYLMARYNGIININSDFTIHGDSVNLISSDYITPNLNSTKDNAIYGYINTLPPH